MSSQDLVLPDADEEIMAGFWEGTRQGVVRIQQCPSCGDVRFPPLPICPQCWATGQQWIDTEPDGEVYSYVVYHRALAPGHDVPYAIGRIKMNAGPMFTVKLDIPLDDIKVGMAVTASFREMSDRITMLEFVAA